MNTTFCRQPIWHFVGFFPSDTLIVRVIIPRAGVALPADAISAPQKIFNSSTDAVHLFRFMPRLAKVSPLEKVAAIPITPGDGKVKLH
jgi:hypothetical protein